MRVVRIKAKAGIVVVISVCVLGLLLYKSRMNVDTDTAPSRSIDFIDISDQITKGLMDDIKKRTRGKSRISYRKQIRPPKRRIADGIVDKKVVKNVVHGDDQTGQMGRLEGRHLRHNHKFKTKDKEVFKPTKSSKQTFSSYTIAVLVIACNRPDAIKRCLNGLLKYRPSSDQFPIVVSQDCGDTTTAEAISAYGNKVKHIKQPDLSNINVPDYMKRFQGYYKISRHYKWALGQLFDQMSYDTVLIVEDDLDIAPDFYDYFLATRTLLDQDPSIWCVSAWNDNGKEGMVSGNGLLYRSDFFPGLGWMMTKSLWNEFREKWPAGFWDDWMRESDQRKGRVCIRPEISRTKTFGRIGVSQGQFFDKHLKYIVLNDKKFDFLHEDLSYLIKENYDRDFLGKVAALPVLSIQDIVALNAGARKAVRVNYSTRNDFTSLGTKLGAMVDFKAGVPRTGYHGIVTVIFKGIRVYLTPPNIMK